LGSSVFHLRRRQRAGLLLAEALLLLASACASESHVRQLASSGSAYAAGLDTLLSATRESAADASSARALSEGQGVAEAAVRAEILAAQDAMAQSALAELEKLRRHARLLGRYFDALGDLADDAQDAAASRAAVGSADALANLGRELALSDRLTKAQKDGLGEAVHLAVSQVRNRALCEELEARGDLIDFQLRLHRALLDALRGKLRADRQSAAQLAYDRDVRQPFEEGRVADARTWIADRRGYLLRDKDLAALERASDAASRLRSAWKACLEGGFDAAARRDALRQIDEAVALAGSIEKILP